MNKNKQKFSILRVAISVFVFLILLYCLHMADAYLMNIPHYRDIGSYWTPDGKNIVFIRWHHRKGQKHDFFQIWKINPDGSDPVRLFESQPYFVLYGIRRFCFNSDGSHINLRLNKKKNGKIQDMLYRIPLDPSQKTETRKLDKKFPLDVFLAFRDDMVALRRMKGRGKTAASTLQIYRFDDMKPVKEINFPKNTICVFADFYNGGKKIFGVTRKPNGEDPKKFDNTLCLFDENKKIKFSYSFIDIHYLEKSKVFLGSDLSGKPGFHIFNPKKNKWRYVTTPLNKDGSFSFNVTEDECRIILSDINKLYYIDMNGGGVSEFILPEKMLSSPGENKSGNQLVFSNGDIICKMNPDGTNIRELTKPSERSMYLKNKQYRTYLDIRRRTLNAFNSVDNHH
ncbi:MAG: hypothetical protein K8T10_12125 [Candidatus Eremiobacteraeota bacterium]|nr:hypothetical protein [Candidatus Eremiobacteraeota bacterium]